MVLLEYGICDPYYTLSVTFNNGYFCKILVVRSIAFLGKYLFVRALCNVTYLHTRGAGY